MHITFCAYHLSCASTLLSFFALRVNLVLHFALLALHLSCIPPYTSSFVHFNQEQNFAVIYIYIYIEIYPHRAASAQGVFRSLSPSLSGLQSILLHLLYFAFSCTLFVALFFSCTLPASQFTSFALHLSCASPFLHFTLLALHLSCTPPFLTFLMECISSFCTSPFLAFTAYFLH